jgi:hypothetical protein
MPRGDAATPEPQVVGGAAGTVPRNLGVFRPCFTEYNDRLYIFGGVTERVECTMVAARLDWDSAAGTGAWTVLTSLKDPLGCRRDGVAFPVRDLTTGAERIIIYGGIEDRAADGQLVGTDHFLIYDPATDSYTQGPHPSVAGVKVDGLMRGTSDGTTGLFMAGNTAFYSFVLDNGVATVTERPGFGFSDWPTFSYAAGRFYAFEGKSQRVFSLALGEPAWQQHPDMLDQHAYGAVAVSNTRFVVIGGYQQAPVDPFQLEEYNPLK